MIFTICKKICRFCKKCHIYARHKDGYTGLKYDYGYDAIGRLIRTDISKTSNGAAVGSTEYGYNTRGHLVSITNDIGGNAYGQYYSYSQTDIDGTLPNAKDGLPTRYRALGVNTDYAYDSLNRLTKRNVDLATDIETLYTYKDSALRGTGYTTTQLATEKLGGISYGYNYDNMGNITSIVKGSNEYRSYLYDDLGQLTQERNVSSSTMTSFSYNHLGNIVEKHINDYNGINEKAKVRYGYSADSNAGWNYLLTSITTVDYTDGGSTTTETIDYDAIGNPITYRGAAMAWRGRQLTGHTKNGVTSTFSYDADGLRSSKTVGGVKTEYQYVGDQLFYENRGNGNELYYFYDSYGNLSRIYHHNNGARVAYFVTTNAQGDVIALYNASGVKVGAYDYDAWGNQRVFVVTQDSTGANVHTQINPETQYLTHIVNLNPFRYRGYYFDRDLGLYYLQSRYYDSSIGRFINTDNITDSGAGILGYNTFMYCGNNPINAADPSGHECVCITHRVRGDHICNDPENAHVVLDSEHRKKGTTNPANKNKHQKGQTRKQKDKHGGERGDQRRPQDRSNKRHITIPTEDLVENNYYIDTCTSIVGVVGCVVALGYVVINDLSGVGVADDALVIPILTLITETVKA